MKRWAWYALIGLGAFLLARILLRLPTVWSVAAGLAVWLALQWIIGEPAPEAHVPGMTDAEVQSQLREADAKVRRLRVVGRRMPTAALRQRVTKITNLADRIVLDLRQDPKDVRSARRFLDYYLDATLTVIQRYAELAQKGSMSPEVQPVLAKFDTLLDTIENTFEKQLNRLLRDDTLDLDTDISVLKQMMDSEGL